MKSPGTIRFRPDSFSLVNLVLKYWKVLLITGIGAFIISAVLSLTITPRFRSSVVLYPTENVAGTQTLFGIAGTSTPLFGDEDATEKVLQILRSDRIKEYLVNKYDLIKHYRINETAKYKYTLLENRMNRSIISRKTQYNSVEISVLDTDPVTACTMANDIARQVDTVFNLIVQDAGRKSYISINNTYTDQLGKIRSLEDSLNRMETRGSIPLSQKYGRPGIITSNSTGGVMSYSAGFLKLVNMFESENENLSAISSRLTEADMLARQIIPYTHIINEAKVPERKALPKRSMIVLASTFSTLLLMIFILGLSDAVVRDDK